MRLLALAGAAGLTLAATAGATGLALVAAGQMITAANAMPFATRYCAQYRGGGENCGFYSFNQCLAAVNGVGGACIVAPWQDEVVRVQTRRGGYWVYRSRVD